MIREDKTGMLYLCVYADWQFGGCYTSCSSHFKGSRCGGGRRYQTEHQAFESL